VSRDTTELMLADQAGVAAGPRHELTVSPGGCLSMLVA
jgi:hypothetical protein